MIAKYRMIALLLVALAAGGCSESWTTSPPESGPLATEASVRRFSDCAELQEYLSTSQQTEVLLRQRFGAPPITVPGLDFNAVQSPADGMALQEKIWTGTNTQEVGIDEADFVKSDGEYLYSLAGGQLVIVDAWPATTMSEVSRRTIEGSPLSLFVHNDTLVTFSSLWQGPVTSLTGFVPVYQNLIKMTVFDVADRSAPVLLRELYLEGSFNDARLVAGRVHLVLSTQVALAGPLTPLPVDGTGNATLVAGFPRTFDRRYLSGGTSTETEVLCSCANVLRPAEANGNGLLTLVTLDLGSPLGATGSVSILGYGGTVYASADHLVVAATSYGPWMWRPVDLGQSSEPRQTTVLHRFSLGATPTYEGSAKVSGRVLNTFALSEFNGILRIATTEDNWWSGVPPANRLYLLAPEGESYREVGRLEGLGKPGESIYAVRYLGERAFVVTFLRTDPLYALDLADPAAPKKAGELEVPGLSTYLHPVGANHLIGVGREGQSLKLSLYDVTDLAAPQQVGSDYTIGLGSVSDAEYDHRAFTYFAEQQLLALPVTSWNTLPLADGTAFTGYFNGLQLFDVDLATGFSLRGTVDHSGFLANDGQWGWPLQVRRSFFISEPAAGSFLYSVSGGGIRVNDVDDLQRALPALPLPYENPFGIAVPVSGVLYAEL